MALNNGINQTSLLTTFTSSGTWTPDSRTQAITIIGWGGGPAGGSGRQGLTNASGGGAGGGGCGVMYVSCLKNFFTVSSHTVTIGGTAAGGTAKGSASTNGNPGTIDNPTSIGTYFTPVSASGAPGGSTGNAVGLVASGMNSTTGGFVTTANGGTGTTGNPANLTAINPQQQFCSTGGGGGAGANSSSVRTGGTGAAIISNGITLIAAAAGGVEGGTINGANGGSATYPQHGILYAGVGGGGGGGNSVGASSGTGGNGGTPGGPGGGGGGGINGVASGAGGIGARGELWIIEYF